MEAFANFAPLTPTPSRREREQEVSPRWALCVARSGTVNLVGKIVCAARGPLFVEAIIFPLIVFGAVHRLVGIP